MRYTKIPPYVRLSTWRTYAPPLLKDKALQRLVSRREFAPFVSHVALKFTDAEELEHPLVLWFIRHLWHWVTDGEDPLFADPAGWGCYTDHADWGCYSDLARIARSHHWPLEPIPTPNHR